MSNSRAWRISAATMVLATSPIAVSVAGSSSAFDSPSAFVSRAQLHDWIADGERGLWIQAGDLRWFYARFTGPCHGLRATNSLVFDTGHSENIDSKSAVIVPGSGRCTVMTFASSDGPPENRNADVAPQPQAQ